MQSGNTVVSIDPYRQRAYEQRRDRVLAELMLKRLDFERRVQRGLLTDEQVVTEGACLSVELFKAAADWDL